MNLILIFYMQLIDQTAISLTLDILAKNKEGHRVFPIRWKKGEIIMTNEEIKLNLDIATDKLVTVKDYYERDCINQKFAEFMEHEITHLVEKQLTETLGSALIEAINSTAIDLAFDKAKSLEPVCLKGSSRDHRIKRTIIINSLGQIRPSIVWHCGNTVLNYANEQGVTLTELIKNNNYIKKDQTNAITISVNNPAFEKPMDITVCWFVDLDNDETVNVNNPVCYINTETSDQFGSQLIKHLAENAGYIYCQYKDFPNRDPYKDQNTIYLSLPNQKNKQ